LPNIARLTKIKTDQRYIGVGSLILVTGFDSIFVFDAEEMIQKNNPGVSRFAHPGNN
jgi:hypothetical protein